MERTASEQFKAWKNKKNRKPLLVTGVRQCGKTYLIKKFGQSEFEDMAYFNFEGNTGLQSVFTYDFDTDRILDELGSIILGKKIIPGSTLVVFDEIRHLWFLMKYRIAREPYRRLSISVRICRNFIS